MKSLTKLAGFCLLFVAVLPLVPAGVLMWITSLIVGSSYASRRPAPDIASREQLAPPDSATAKGIREVHPEFPIRTCPLIRG